MDLKIAEILMKECNRQDNTLELIASENFASESVMALCGSEFTNKYAEGYPTKRYYNGCEFVDEIETLAMKYVKRLFGCDFANVQPHSGANANLAVFKAFLKPGDMIMGMDLAAGGHLSHGAGVNISGAWFNINSYGVDENGLLDYDNIQKLATLYKPKMIIAGGSAYPRQIDWKRFREIADSIGAILLVDMAHYAGLIAGGVYDNPLPYADVVTSTTHKTLRGPRGGIILWNNPDYTRKINSAVFPGTQGGPLMHIVAAKAQCFYEALDHSFRFYARDVVENSRAMCEVFVQNGYKVQTSGTDSHIILLDLSDHKYSGREAADLLEKNGITVNKNSVPNGKRSFIDTSGIRLGTAAETTRGKTAEDFRNIASNIVNILK